MNELAQLVSSLGLPVVLLLGVALGAWRLGKYVAKRLLDEEDGLLTKLAARHSAFLDETSSHLRRQELLAEQNAALLTNLAALQADPKGPASTIDTNAALIHLAEALEQIAEDRGVDISTQVEAIRRTLSRAR
jgi:hypothetical protein